MLVKTTILRYLPTECLAQIRAVSNLKLKSRQSFTSKYAVQHTIRHRSRLALPRINILSSLLEKSIMHLSVLLSALPSYVHKGMQAIMQRGGIFVTMTAQVKVVTIVALIPALNV